MAVPILQMKLYRGYLVFKFVILVLPFSGPYLHRKVLQKIIQNPKKQNAEFI